MNNTIKIIGKLSSKELSKRNIRSNRRVNKGGTLIGSVIITDIKNIPGISWCRCNIRRNKQGLHAVRNGVYIRQVSDKVVKDNSFKSA